MKRTRLIALAAMAATLAATQLASGAAPGSKQTCRGLSVTITENRKGDPIGAGKDVVLGTNHRDVVNLAGGNDKFYGDDGNDVACAGPGEDLLLGADDEDGVMKTARNPVRA